MVNEVDPEFDQIMASVETLEQCAIDHENHRTDPHKGPCWENRAYLVAVAMDRMGLAVEDIGLVARYLMDFEIEADTPDVPDDDVLNATELRLVEDNDGK